MSETLIERIDEAILDAGLFVGQPAARQPLVDLLASEGWTEDHVALATSVAVRGADNPTAALAAILSNETKRGSLFKDVDGIVKRRAKAAAESVCPAPGSGDAAQPRRDGPAADEASSRYDRARNERIAYAIIHIDGNGAAAAAATIGCSEREAKKLAKAEQDRRRDDSPRKKLPDDETHEQRVERFRSEMAEGKLR